MGAGTVKTVCPYCGVGCGILATPDGRGGASIAGDPDHPANFGRLCSKGSALGETIGLEGRLLAPRIDGREASWDAALDRIAGAFRNAIDTYGPESVAIYGSGQLLTEDYYVANKLMKGFIGSANIDTNSRLCMASSVAGQRRAFGSDTVPGTYEDLEEADLVVLVGSNLAWCHPVLYQRIAAAREARPRMRLVVIDPRRTASCDLADLHLPLRPDSDVALFNGLLARIESQGAVDAAFVGAHVSGFREALAEARGWDVARVAATAGLDSDDLERFYRLWIGTEKVVTVFSQGVNQSRSGTDKVNAILNCHLATGRIGKPGSGPFSVTGQPNAMGGREVGGLSNLLAAHLDLDNAAHRNAVAGFWNAPNMVSGPGLKAVDLFRACGDGRIKALWILSSNPAVSMPDADAVTAALAGLRLRGRLGHDGRDGYRAAGRCAAAGRRLGREIRHRHQFRAPHLAPARLPRAAGRSAVGLANARVGRASARLDRRLRVEDRGGGVSRTRVALGAGGRARRRFRHRRARRTRRSRL